MKETETLPLGADILLTGRVERNKCCMFTGLVAELGTVRGLKRVQNSYHLTVAARKVLDNLKIGDSVAVNGVCLTVVVLGSGEFTADVMPETMRLSNLRICAAATGSIWKGRCG